MTHQSKPILLLSPLPPPIGGISTWTSILLKKGLPNQKQINLINTRIKGNRNIFDKASVSIMEIFRNLHIICYLLYQLILKRPKVVHICSSLSPLGTIRELFCGYLIYAFKVPIITQYHGNVADYPHHKAFVLRRLMKLTAINIVGNVPSLKTAQTIVNNKKFLILPNFIEDELFCYERVEQNHSRLQALYAGGITGAKGCKEILAVAKEHADIDFHLYGKLHEDMRLSISDAASNVFIHPPIDRLALLERMKQTDFLLFPSHTEGFPLTVLEAMTVGLAIIATDVGAIPEMVDANHGGFIVKSKDMIALSAAVEKMKTNRNLLTSMGRYNREKSYALYRYSIVSNQLADLYEQLSCVA